MPTTPNYALRYPLPTDPADVPLDLQKLATDVDSALYGVQQGTGLIIASTVAGLGVGAAGKKGWIRPQPTTFNAGGATALPAAVLNVGDTTDFPTAGVITTPNGDVTYTGKTATTFTGCTGGTGTLAANANIVLKTGTPPTGYHAIGLSYDPVIGKWVSDVALRIPFAGSIVPSTGTQIAGLEPAYFSGGVIGDAASPGGMIQLPWRTFDTAGLVPQFKHRGKYVFNAGTLMTWWVAYRSCNRNGFLPNDLSTGIVPVSGTAVAMSGTGTTEATAKHTESAWASIDAGYTVADILDVILAGQVAGIGGATRVSAKGLLEMRWVG
jgi:hypothetical protein